MGQFKDLEYAREFGRKHELEEIVIKKTAYANLIGSYTSSFEIEARIQSLKVAGYSPYVIKDRDGRSHLFVGAFLTKEGAEEQYSELKSDSVQSKVVRR
ncbi:MAG: hypothetical protein JRJ14_11190 [Deltaproteobacteria bacterium]|nr:hypothetical protein [Deltaproteobacteria bacterium]